MFLMLEHLYVHIPYCTSKCDYCDFYSEYPKQRIEDDYVDAISLELQERYQREPVSTVFFGGGTPSLLRAQQIQRMLKMINTTNDCEITIECNPETITLEKLKEYKQVEINRISIGVQTFDETKQKLIGRNRVCNPVEKIDIALSVFDNVGIDLMYALPKQKIHDIKQEICCIPQGVKHVSYYSLTLEEGTPFFTKQKGKHPIEDDLQADLAEEALRQLAIKGFTRYEISNFARKGYECKHNLAYWNYQDYLGVGAGAVSTIHGLRTENVKDIVTYVQGKRVADSYKLTSVEQKNERLMMQLRTTQGILFTKRYSELLETYPDLLCLQEGRFFLTDKGFLIYDTIVSELML